MSQATGNQIGAEAVKAAGHFGNTTAASNRNVQYVVLSPTGTHPDGFNATTSQFCAWHDYTGDTSLSRRGARLAVGTAGLHQRAVRHRHGLQLWL